MSSGGGVSGVRAERGDHPDRVAVKDLYSVIFRGKTEISDELVPGGEGHTAAHIENGGRVPDLARACGNRSAP